MHLARPKQWLSSSVFASLILAALPASAGTFSYTEFNSDANSGIFADDVFTAKTDFARPAGDRVVNGVAFTDFDLIGSTPVGATLPSYVLDYGPVQSLGRFAGFGGNAALLISDFYYGGTEGKATLTLNNLEIGKTYVSSWYNQSYGAAARNVNFTPSDTGVTYLFNEDFTPNGRGNILRYTFTAQSTSISFAIDAVNDADSFHHYAFANAVARTDLVTPRSFQAVSTGTLVPLPAFSSEVRTGDLLEVAVAPGGITSGGNFAQESSGGILKLTDGNFVIKGGNVTQGQPDANSEIATASNGAFLQYALDTNANPFGFDISLIQVFGGWNDNGRDKQLFNVLYSKVGSDSYTLLGSQNFDSQAAGGLPSAIWTAFDVSLTNIDGIRFEFPNGQESGYVGLGEIDVVGAASVPEPAAALLSLMAAGGIITLRRRR